MIFHQLVSASQRLHGKLRRLPAPSFEAVFTDLTRCQSQVFRVHIQPFGTFFTLIPHPTTGARTYPANSAITLSCIKIACARSVGYLRAILPRIL